jgi:UDP-N-acetylglucosamine--N-acetylmuramyl-(pentapeptide) pyrophosphoryl-undecaprenol N-acetylglucosamine transferase
MADKRRRILLTGGGTGGHITPILAVAHELKKLDPSCEITYVGERGGRFADLVEGNGDIDRTATVYSGKFRRYHGESWLRRLSDIKTNYQNIRDVFLVSIGLMQSLFLLGRLKPDVILLKGGFVGVPVGLAAAIRRAPFITHDSDAMPGLANRLVSRWAVWHATGMPAHYYAYPKESIRYVGVLVGPAYQPVDTAASKAFKVELGFKENEKILLVTGGSLGARRLNEAMAKAAPKLLERHADVRIVHQVGRGNTSTYEGFEHPRLTVMEFLQDMHRYTGAADLVVTRAGANTLAELGTQGKPCVVVPNPLLTGGHQLKNADFLLREEAAEVLTETQMRDTGLFCSLLEDLLTNPARRKALADRMQRLTKRDAAQELAGLLLETAGGR